MTVSTDAPLLLTVFGAAAKLGCGKSTVYKLIEDGELKSIKIGRLHRVTMASIERYIERRLAS